MGTTDTGASLPVGSAKSSGEALRAAEARLAAAPQPQDREQEGREEDLRSDGDHGRRKDREPLLAQRAEALRGPAPDDDGEERNTGDTDERQPA